MRKLDELKELGESLNVPKQVLEKSEELLKALFGPSVKDLSGIVSDQIRLRRYKNQIKILLKASEFIKESGLNPKELNLKVLAPMIEFSSLEEEASLQLRWSKLISKTLTEEGHVRFQKKCVLILSEISNEEALVLDEIYKEAITLRKFKFDRYNQSYKDRVNLRSEEGIKLSEIYVGGGKISKNVDLPNISIRDIFEGLVSLGVVNWDTPGVEIHAEKDSNNPDDLDIDVDVQVHKPNGVYLTQFGVEFVRSCNIEE